MKPTTVYFAVILFMFSITAHAQEVAQPAIDNPAVQRVDIRASASINSLKLRTTMTFPQRLKNIKDTAEYLLEPIQYKLVLSPSYAAQTKRILARPLLRVHSDGSLKMIEDALLQVAGDDTILVVDHENKLITLEFIDPSKSN